jgi:hypothetical protein
MTQAATTKESIMEFRKTLRAVLATLIVLGTCISTPASAHNTGHVVRDILLAPLLLPAAIVAATAPRPVVYQETYYVEQPRHVVVHHGRPRHEVRRYESRRGHHHHYR